LLAVLLRFGAKLKLETVWNLRALDRKSFSFFIPPNFLDYGKKTIEEGMNFTNRIGFGVMNVSDFNNEFEGAMKANFPLNTASLPKEAAALCAVASLLFPDRLPLHLEKMF
jgi:hypothetical protein